MARRINAFVLKGLLYLQALGVRPEYGTFCFGDAHGLECILTGGGLEVSPAASPVSALDIGIHCRRDTMLDAGGQKAGI